MQECPVLRVLEHDAALLCLAAHLDARSLHALSLCCKRTHEFLHPQHNAWQTCHQPTGAPGFHVHGDPSILAHHASLLDHKVEVLNVWARHEPILYQRDSTDLVAQLFYRLTHLWSQATQSNLLAADLSALMEGIIEGARMTSTLSGCLGADLAEAEFCFWYGVRMRRQAILLAHPSSTASASMTDLRSRLAAPTVNGEDMKGKVTALEASMMYLSRAMCLYRGLSRPRANATCVVLCQSPVRTNLNVSNDITLTDWTPPEPMDWTPERITEAQAALDELVPVEGESSLPRLAVVTSKHRDMHTFPGFRELPKFSKAQLRGMQQRYRAIAGLLRFIEVDLILDRAHAHFGAIVHGLPLQQEWSAVCHAESLVHSRMRMDALVRDHASLLTRKHASSWCALRLPATLADVQSHAKHLFVDLYGAALLKLVSPDNVTNADALQASIRGTVGDHKLCGHVVCSPLDKAHGRDEALQACQQHVCVWHLWLQAVDTTHTDTLQRILDAEPGQRPKVVSQALEQVWSQWEQQNGVPPLPIASDREAALASLTRANSGSEFGSTRATVDHDSVARRLAHTRGFSKTATMHASVAAPVAQLRKVNARSMANSAPPDTLGTPVALADAKDDVNHGEDCTADALAECIAPPNAVLSLSGVGVTRDSVDARSSGGSSGGGGGGVLHLASSDGEAATDKAASSVSTARAPEARAPVLPQGDHFGDDQDVEPFLCSVRTPPVCFMVDALEAVRRPIVRDATTLLPRSTTVRQDTLRMSRSLVSLFAIAFREAMQLWGTPAIDFAVLMLGSGAREEMCPGSDLEYAMVLDMRFQKLEPGMQSSVMAHFRSILLFVQHRVLCMGESTSISQGFCLDAVGNHPLCELTTWLGTPSTILQDFRVGVSSGNFDPTNSSLISETLPVLVSRRGEAVNVSFERLRLDYMRRTPDGRNAPTGQVLSSNLLWERMSCLDDYMLHSTTIDAKNALLRLPTFLLTGLYQYAIAESLRKDVTSPNVPKPPTYALRGTVKTTSWDKLEYLRTHRPDIMDEETAQLLEDALTMGLGIRSCLHRVFCREFDMIGQNCGSLVVLLERSLLPHLWDICVKMLGFLIKFLFGSGCSGIPHRDRMNRMVQNLHNALEWQIVDQEWDKAKALRSIAQHIGRSGSFIDGDDLEARKALYRVRYLCAPRRLEWEEKVSRMWEKWDPSKTKQYKRDGRLVIEWVTCTGAHVKGLVPKHLQDEWEGKGVDRLRGSLHGLRVVIPLHLPQDHANDEDDDDGDVDIPEYLMGDTEDASALPSSALRDLDDVFEEDDDNKTDARACDSGKAELEEGDGEATEDADTGAKAEVDKAGDQQQQDKTPFGFLKWFPEYPGVQRAVFELGEVLSWDPIHTTICKVTSAHDMDGLHPQLPFVCSEKDQVKDFIPCLLAETVRGSNLQDILKRQGTLQNALARDALLTRYWFTMKILHALVVHPEDDKADNIILEQVRDDQEGGDFVGHQRYRLTSIDSDHAYTEAVSERVGLLGREVKVHLKSIAMCSDMMYEPIDASAAAIFSDSNSYYRFEGWLCNLEAYASGSINALFQEGEQRLLSDLGSLVTEDASASPSSARKSHPSPSRSPKRSHDRPQTLRTALQRATLRGVLRKDDSKASRSVLLDDLELGECVLPIVFKSTTIYDLYGRVRKLKLLLGGESNIHNHFDLVSEMCPALGRVYKAVFQRATTPELRFDRLPTDYTVMEDEVPSDGDVEHQISSTDLTALDGVSGMSSRTMVATTHYVSSYRTLATRKGGTVDPVEYMLPKKALETLKKCNDLWLAATNVKEGILCMQSTDAAGTSTDAAVAKVNALEEAILREMILRDVCIESVHNDHAKRIAIALLEKLDLTAFIDLSPKETPVLNNDRIRNLLKRVPNDTLYRLDCNRCVGLQGSRIGSLFQIKSLGHLNLSHTNISRLGSKFRQVIFPSLRTLSIRGCTALTQLSVEAPELRLINANECTGLKYLWVSTRIGAARGEFAGCGLKNVQLRGEVLCIADEAPKLQRKQYYEVALAVIAHLKRIGADPAESATEVKRIVGVLNTQAEIHDRHHADECMRRLIHVPVWARWILEADSNTWKCFVRLLDEKLEKLSLRSIRLTRVCAYVLQNLLMRHPRLAHLELHDTRVDLYTAHILSGAICSLENLQSFKLVWSSGTSSKAQTIHMLMSSLRGLHNLTSLTLSQCAIDDHGMKAVGALAMVSTSLKTLDVRWNAFGDVGAGYIVKALLPPSAAPLETVLLSGEHNLTYKSAKAFAQVLATNTRLKTLSLPSDRFERKSVLAIRRALQKNRVLTQLSPASLWP